MAKKIKLSQREHPLYADNYDRWTLYESAAKGGEYFITNKNLKSHRLEETDDYNERLERAYFLNYCDTIPKIYNSYIFKGDIKRKPDDGLVLFRQNTDGRGTNIDEFIKKAGYLASIYGVIHILVDILPSSKKNPSKADDRIEGRQPICSIILPTQLKDWSVDSKGEFNWILYEYLYYEDLDPNIEREEVTHYKLITREGWEIQDEDGKPVKFEDGTPNKGPNTLGIVPVATVYHNAINDDKVGESLIKDVVYINRAVLNWSSCMDEQIERQTFSQLVIPDDGTLATEESEDPLQIISTSSVWTFMADAKNPPAFISPNTENLVTIWKLIVDHIKEMFRMTGLQGGTSDLYTSRSGRQSQMSFQGVNSALAEKSATYQKAENDISRLAYLQLGMDLTSFEEVSYPSTFDVVALAEEIDGMLKIMERNFSETLNKTMMKEIARKAVPTALNNIKKTIESEIDAGDGIVDIVKATGIEQEKQGDGNPNTDMSSSYKTASQKAKEDTSHRREE